MTLLTFQPFRLMAGFAILLAGTPAFCLNDLPSPGTDTAFAVAVANNQVFIGGQVLGALPGFKSAGQSDAFVQSYDQNGNLQWTQQFGSSREDRVLGMATDSTGVYAVGYTDGNITGNPAGQKSIGQVTSAFLAKFSYTGTLLWIQEFGGGAVTRLQAAASDGTYLYVCGYTETGLNGQPFEGKQDIFVQKYDQSGDLAWTREIGTNEIDRSYGIAVNSNGVFVAGRTNGTFSGQANQGGIDALAFAFDTSGNKLWLSQFGTPADERGWGIAQDATGIYITGRTEGSFPGYTNQGSDDAYTVKFDFAGNMLWVNQFGTPQFDRGTAVSTDSTGVYSIGYTDGSLPGSTSYGQFDYFIRKFDTSGDVLWTVQFGTSQSDEVWGSATDPTGVYIVGLTGGTLPGQTAKKGFFVAKYSTEGAPLWFSETETKSLIP